LDDKARSWEQNKRMWAMLREIAEQAMLCGQKWTEDEWKVIFLYELHKEIKLLPSLDGLGVVPYGAQSSSTLTMKQMTAMIDLMHKFGAEQDVKFADDWTENERHRK